ncbi:MAG: hypothetical protein HYW26_01210 [Candidatus Aenigmarchaeota archaeon]|nr:hypothetical protein [Candidatus Aenigmarchaeota archaeon]
MAEYLGRIQRDFRREGRPLEIMHFSLMLPGQATENAMKAYGGEIIGLGYGNPRSRRPYYQSQ